MRRTSNMSKNYRKALENLDLFLADTEGQTTEEIAKQLKDQGVDVEEFLSKVKSVVRKGYQGHVRATADCRMPSHHPEPARSFW